MTLHMYKIEYRNDFSNSSYGDPDSKRLAQPIIYLYCRDDEGKKVIKKIKNFQPYFYIDIDANIPSFLSKYVVKIEEVEYTTIMGEKCKKIYTQNPMNVKFLREELVHHGIKTFEDDILYVLRFLIDHKKKLETQGVDLKADTTARRMYLDIETSTDEGFPEPKYAQEAITCITCYDSFKKLTPLIPEETYDKMNPSLVRVYHDKLKGDKDLKIE